VVARALLATVVALLMGTVLAAPAGSATRCFGAAARDPQHPCFNPSRSFTPSVEHADDIRSSPCELTDEEPTPICTFGVSAARAKGHIALVGDSHALHWRGTVDAVAQANRWHGWSLTAPGCFFSDAVKRMGVGAREPCTAWYLGVRKWFRAHPEVSTVFVSQNATTPVAFGPGETERSVKSAGFRRAWRELPKTVKRVVVIRDTPDPRDDMYACVERVRVAATGRPGPLCATPRAAAMRFDTAVATVAQLRSPRYRSVDMTSFFCGPRECYPVIGGSLVHRDIFGHLNEAYARSLGPYMARKARALRLG
jgi:hypothetical protein